MGNKDPVKNNVDVKDIMSEENSNIDTKKAIASSLKVAIIYFVIGVLWIAFSESVIGFYIHDKETIAFLSLIKGWVFIGMTGTFIYFLVSCFTNQVNDLKNNLALSNLKLFTTDKELELIKELFDSLIDDKIMYQQQCRSYQEQLNSLNEIYNTILEITGDVIWEEINGQVRVSERWFENIGYSWEDCLKLGGWENLLHPADREAVLSKSKEIINSTTQYFQHDLRIKVKNGDYRWMRVRGKFLINHQGQISRKIALCTDITEIKEYEKKLYDFVCYDQLTGLQNRVALNEITHKLISDQSDNNFALLFVDIDNFKNVNDTMGYTYGDKLLLQVSERLQNVFAMDIDLFRIGGDEFIILMKHYAKKAEIERKAVDIIRTFNDEFEIMQNTLFITASIGVSLYPEHGTNIDTLLKNADIAVHKAKEKGKNRIVFYNEPMNESISERMKIEKNLRTALHNDEFELYYQPQLDLENNYVTGFEALIRWNNNELGKVSPKKFISIAEETRQIIPIGEWVFKSACQFLKKLNQNGYKDLGISINISILQLTQDNFVDMVIETIDKLKLNADKIELEITETILMEFYDTIAGKLRLLRSNGFKIALDDFGKGYSSLNYLIRLPITTLKIDKTFIDKISFSKRKTSITDLIINLGRSMNLNVVAEGVESEEQMECLSLLQCHKIQGYYFSKPLSEKEIMLHIREKWNIHNQIKNSKEELYVN